MSYSNIGEEDAHRTLSAFGLTIHMPSQADHFDLSTRTPRARPAEVVEEEQ